MIDIGDGGPGWLCDKRVAAFLVVTVNAGVDVSMGAVCIRRYRLVERMLPSIDEREREVQDKMHTVMGLSSQPRRGGVSRNARTQRLLLSRLPSERKKKTLIRMRNWKFTLCALRLSRLLAGQKSDPTFCFRNGPCLVMYLIALVILGQVLDGIRRGCLDHS